MDDRFMANVKVNQDTGCWEWQGSRTANGYGMVGRLRRTRRAHRYAYERTYGDIPDGLCVCHKCDVRHCVNPEHLWLGTHKSNAEDRVSKRRSAVGLSHPRAKLQEGDASYIRMLLNLGAASKDLERAYNITQAAVSQIRHRKAWYKNV